MPRVGRKASSLILFGLFFAATLVAATAFPVSAQGDGGNATPGDGNETPGDANDTPGDGLPVGETLGADFAPGTRVLTIGPLNDACDAGGCLWDTPLLVYRPGETIILRADLTGAIPHNLKIALDDLDEEPPFEVVYEPPAPDGDITVTNADIVVSATFEVPEDFAGSIGYYCTLHQPTMTGFIVTPDEFAAAGAAGGEPIHHMGVHFLAYWVGLIAFALLFIVYGITFFLFKYNETSATTDQWDRTGAGAPDVKNTMSGSSATLLAIVIGVVALAAIVYLARVM